MAEIQDEARGRDRETCKSWIDFNNKIVCTDDLTPDELGFSFVIAMICKGRNRLSCVMLDSTGARVISFDLLFVVCSDEVAMILVSPTTQPLITLAFVSSSYR